MDAGELVSVDRRHVWHPYGPMPAQAAALPVRSARGACIKLEDGRELVDGMSSWWCVIHGYRHPALDAAVRDQLTRMAHVMFGGLTHRPAVALAERLVAVAPPGLEHVFLADSGSVSVEVALKMCLQLWRGEGRPAKTRFMALRGAYHGDTLGAMALCDPVGGMHHAFADSLPAHVFADLPPAGFGSPPSERYIEHLERLVSCHAHELAAVVVEPVVQGAGGMRFYAPGYLRELRGICDAHDVLLVCDEIATGFGRTGALFGSGHAEVAPDVMCVGKALTGGYMTLAATLCSARVAQGVSRSDSGGLMHGPTFMANPLACACALASLELLEQGEWPHQVARIERHLRRSLAPARDLEGVRDVRVLGAIGVIQLDGPVDVGRATSAALDEGAWLRPFRDLIYTMPPYVTSDDQLDRIAAAAVAAAGVSLRERS